MDNNSNKMSDEAKVNWLLILGMVMVYLLFALVSGLYPISWAVVSKVFFIMIELILVGLILTFNVGNLR